MKGSNGNIDKAKSTTNNRAIECFLFASFWISSLFFYYFFFSLSKFFSFFCSFDIFSQQKAHNEKPQKV